MSQTPYLGIKYKPGFYETVGGYVGAVGGGAVGITAFKLVAVALTAAGLPVLAAIATVACFVVGMSVAMNYYAKKIVTDGPHATLGHAATHTFLPFLAGVSASFPLNGLVLKIAPFLSAAEGQFFSSACGSVTGVIAGMAIGRKIGRAIDQRRYAAHTPG